MPSVKTSSITTSLVSTFLAGASMLSLPATVRYLVSILIVDVAVVDRLHFRKEHPQHHRRVPKLRSWFRAPLPLGNHHCDCLTKFSPVERNNCEYTPVNQQGKSLLRHDSTCLMRIICFPTCAQRTAVKLSHVHQKEFTNMYSEKLWLQITACQGRRCRQQFHEKASTSSPSLILDFMLFTNHLEIYRDRFRIHESLAPVCNIVFVLSVWSRIDVLLIVSSTRVSEHPQHGHAVATFVGASAIMLLPATWHANLESLRIC